MLNRVLPPSPQKMKLMLLAILTASVVSVNTDSGASFYRRGLRHQPDCDCDYFPGGCRVRKKLQSISYKRRRKKLTCLGKSPKHVTPLHFELKKWNLAKKKGGIKGQKKGFLGQYLINLWPWPPSLLKQTFFMRSLTAKLIMRAWRGWIHALLFRL